ncbi:M28 family peptidase [Neorhodopirellula pilleata]|uniref:Aminopeptidase YwaD n=1 Tax=Neorhodopirellula pilleata TaxID=2714738 RepID=A0A5C6ARR8_9BACT|nr:M28 family peptidase [Neorhodopirellula pilleata]TWU01786.1 Aminopeptidase YwaD precursor [Neorhodopirellula pilleata]
MTYDNTMPRLAFFLVIFSAGSLIIHRDARADLNADLSFLTSDELQGRSSIDPTIHLAAQFLAERFEQIGLDTNLFDGGPLQSVDIPIGRQIGDVAKNYLLATGDSGRDALELAKDFTPMAIGVASGQAEAEMIWVGYGVQAEKLQYDDYAGVDVRGKIVVMLRKEPGPENPDSPFDGKENTRHAFFQTKVATAIDAGAIGIILVNDSASTERMIAQVESRRQAEVQRREAIEKQLTQLPAEAINIRKKLEDQLNLARESYQSLELEVQTARDGLMGMSEAGDQPQGGQVPSIDPNTNKKTRLPPVPVIAVSRPIADRWVQLATAANGGESRTLKQVTQRIDTTFQPDSFAIPGIRAKMQVDLTAAIVPSPNVIGTLEGAGELSDETIVIGAHYDHVGTGGYGSLAPGTVAVHNGADDNASGTAVMLRVAECLSKSLPSIPNRRRVVFIAFTGEERGLLGSQHYVEQPRFPITKTVAMINMDMVGRLLDNELTVYGTESADVMDTILDEANSKAGFKLDRIGSGYGPSDHASFYGAGVPVLFFFTGLHSDYHRPSDDFEKLNLDGMRRITDMICQVSERLATIPERPVYNQTENNVQIRRQLTVFMGVQLSQQPAEVVFSSILADGPAEAAGLLAGDRLVAVGGKPITQLDALFEQLRRRSPGDKLPLEVRRGDEVLKLDVTLRAR